MYVWLILMYPYACLPPEKTRLNPFFKYPPASRPSPAQTQGPANGRHVPGPQPAAPGPRRATAPLQVRPIRAGEVSGSRWGWGRRAKPLRPGSARGHSATASSPAPPQRPSRPAKCPDAAAAAVYFHSGWGRPRPRRHRPAPPRPAAPAPRDRGGLWAGPSRGRSLGRRRSHGDWAELKRGGAGLRGALLWAGRERGGVWARTRLLLAPAVETTGCASGDPGGVASEEPARPGLPAFRGNWAWLRFSKKLERGQSTLQADRRLGLDLLRPRPAPGSRPGQTGCPPGPSGFHPARHPPPPPPLGVKSGCFARASRPPALALRSRTPALLLPPPSRCRQHDRRRPGAESRPTCGPRCVCASRWGDWTACRTAGGRLRSALSTGPRRRLWRSPADG